MSSQPSGKRLMPILWFVAAGLAFVAAAISFLDGRDPNLSAIAGGLFCLVMGIIAIRSQRPPSP